MSALPSRRRAPAKTGRRDHLRVAIGEPSLIDRLSSTWRGSGGGPSSSGSYEVLWYTA
jgi:hypothetical protein